MRPMNCISNKQAGGVDAVSPKWQLTERDSSVNRELGNI